MVLFSDKLRVRRTRPIWSRWVAFTSLAVSLLALASPAQAVDATGIGNRYKDGLDTRYSAYTMANYTKAMGYAAYNYQAGTTADNAWDEGKLTSVFGLYGHANAGVFLVDDNRSPTAQHWFMAGDTDDPTDLYRQSDYYRQVTEYLPVGDVDDMKLMILAGCYTANTSPVGWGNFNTSATARGVDSVVTFPGLVYSPATSSTTPLSETNYSGNYFWHRFFYHSNTGVTVGTALARARNDLYAKEGAYKGWDKYVIRGAATNPSGVKIKPAGAGEPLNAKPIATESYNSFGDLTPVSTATVTNPDGAEVTDVSTEEGVRYLRAADGHIVHAVAAPSTSGEVTLTDTQATQAAQAFAARNTAGFANDWKLMEHSRVSHVEGDAITLLRWRPLTAGHPGPREVTIEIDNRTGAVVYYGTTHGAAQTASFQVTASEAIAAARAAIGDDRGTAEAVADTWNRSRWIVTIDRGLTGEPGLQVPDVEQVEIDAVTGAVISRVKT